jgi:hypothetical protein
MRSHSLAACAVLASWALWATGCKSPITTQCTDNDGGLAAVGGPVPGPIDTHCYQAADGTSPGGPVAAQQTDQPSCYPDAGLFPDGGPPPSDLTCGFYEDGGPDGCTPACDQPDGGPDGCAPDYGDTLYNTSGNDDDCKYQVGWSSSPIVRNGNTTFVFTAVHTTDGTPATGANVFAEVYLPSANHVSPSTNPPVQETPVGSGVYTIGPVVFDQPGQWTVRFHLYEDCVDRLPDGPHGHAAFYVHVP